MIYLISNQNRIFDDTIKYISIEKVISMLFSMDWISIDTETSGLDRFKHKLLLLQLGNKEHQFIIDLTTIDIILFKSLLQEKNLIFQNAKFDLQFLYVNNIVPRGKIWDTMLAEQVLYNGLDPISNLSYLTKKYCNFELDKTERLNFIKSNYKLTYDAIIYGADDIKYLPTIKNLQIEKANKKEVLRAIELENEFVKVLAYIEYCGIYLDKDKWVNKYKTADIELIQKEKLLDKWVLNNGYNNYEKKQLDLFSQDINVKSLREVNINWSSTKQVIPLFEEIGIDVSSTETKSGKSVGNKTITPQKHRFEIIKLYLNYQTVKKDFSTYGEKFLEHINPITNRIHANFSQLSATSRLRCGNPNLQNLPADKRTRSCFTTQTEENELVDCDYKAQEDNIFVNNSLEPKMIEFYQLDNADGHNYVASLCFPKEIGNIPLYEIKEKFPELRQLAKSAKFAIHYGGTGHTISKNLNLSKSEGEKIENAYLTAFPKINDYLNLMKKRAKHFKYILISPITGRKFWAKDYDEMEWKKQNEFAKLGCNYPIQGQSAELTKIGLIYFFNWILDNNYFNIVKLVNAVHDEGLCENPKELTPLVSKNLKRCLEKGAEPYCKIVPLTADIEVSSFWVH